MYDTVVSIARTAGFNALDDLMKELRSFLRGERSGSCATTRGCAGVHVYEARDG